LIRFTVDQNGIIFPDIAAKLPGRGAYVTADPEQIIKAQDSGKLSRALAGEFSPDDRGGLPDLIDRLLLKRCQEMLAMGRRSGTVLGGGGKIKAAMAAAGLLIAADASEREARALCGDVDHDWIIKALYSHEMGIPFGRKAIAFAAVLRRQNQQGYKLKEELLRLAFYRGQNRQ
jgi:predicted RNA-binding protein YlxR (DUF448 family)